ncbi:MAG: patatin-like phospholipase family protein [Candidatus Amoebophilus sp.]
MKERHNISQQFIARLLLISLCLESCGGEFDNHPLISTGEEQIASIQPNTQAIITPTSVQPLIGQELTAQGGHAVTFYEIEGKIKANVAMKAPQGFSKSYEGLKVVIEQGTDLSNLPRLGQQAQKRRIHLHLAQGKQSAKVVIYKGAGLMGGSNNKGKEKLQDDEEPDREIEQENDLVRYQALLSGAVEGEAKAQFLLGQRAYESWKTNVQNEDAYQEAITWLKKAAHQKHQAAIALLQQLGPPMIVEECQEKIKFEEAEEKKVKRLEEEHSQYIEDKLRKRPKEIQEENKGKEASTDTSASKPQTQEGTYRYILSLSGGGIRGVLEAYALSHIEKTLAAKILDHFADPDASAPTVRLGESFDLIVGTSTGAIISLAMRVLDPSTNRPRYDMETILGIYKVNGSKIFSVTHKLEKKVRQALYHIHNPKALESVLTDYFKEATLKDVMSPVLITAYDTNKNKRYFFKSPEAKDDSSKNFYLKDVAMATSAPTTYLPPANIESMDGTKYCFVDGAQASVNDPTFEAYKYAKDTLYKGSHFHIISLKTGFVAQRRSLASAAQWGGLLKGAPATIDMLLVSNEEAAEDNVRSMICERNNDTSTPLNFEIDQEALDEMDNATPENLDKLLNYAAKTIEQEKDRVLKTILDTLEDHYAQREYYVFHSLVKEVRNQLQNGNQKVNLSNAYLQKLAMPYVCERAIWEISHALNKVPLSKLTYLDLSGNKLIAKDRSLIYLKNLRSLTYLLLNDTDLTIAGLERLKEANLSLDILQARNNLTLEQALTKDMPIFSMANILWQRRHSSGELLRDIAQAIECYKITFLDSAVMSNLAGYYRNEGQEFRATIMDSMSKDKEVTGSAEWHLGKLYENGWGITKDYKKAIAWYQNASYQNYTEAQCRLGRIYENGIINGMITEKNEQKARHWYEKAAERGSLVARNALCSMYERAVRVRQEDYERAVSQEDMEAQYNLGIMYYKGWGVDKNYQEAKEWYEKAAQQGYAAAQCNLGWMYLNGEGVDKNYQEAKEWYEKAAKQGLASAQYALGWMYANGQGVDKNDNQAVEWFQKAADKGLADAQYNLGWRYANGQGVDKNDNQAVEWFQKAADKGLADAQYNLGWRYANGQGVAKDDNKAVEWFQKAADKGNMDAQYNLGCRYTHGQGVDKDDNKAVEWFQKAAKQGLADAQYALGWRYANGQGVEKDDNKAVE